MSSELEVTPLLATDSDSTALKFLKDNLPAILGAIVTAGAFLGAVTLAGGMMAWARFTAIGLPAIDSVSILPRSELLVLGAFSLLTIAACAALILAFGQSIGRALLGPGSDALPDTAASNLTPSHVREDRDAQLLVMVVVLMALAAGADVFIFELDARDTIALAAVSAVVCIYSLRLSWGRPAGITHGGMRVPVVTRGVQVPVAPRSCRGRLAMWLARPAPRRTGSSLLLAVTVLLLCAGIIMVTKNRFFAMDEGTEKAWVVAYVFSIVFSLLVGWSAARPVDELIVRVRRHVATGSLPRAIRADWQQRATEGAGAAYKLTSRGRVILSGVLLVGIGLAAALMDVDWVAITLLAAFGLITGLFTYGRRVRTSWAFGAAMVGVFLAFGLVAAVGKAIDDPKMQSVALIRSVGGRQSVYWGLYVTEGNGRVWIAWTEMDPETRHVDKEQTELIAVRTAEIAEVRLAATEHVNSALERARTACGELLAVARNDASPKDAPPCPRNEPRLSVTPVAN